MPGNTRPTAIRTKAKAKVRAQVKAKAKVRVQAEAKVKVEAKVMAKEKVRARSDSRQNGDIVEENGGELSQPELSVEERVNMSSFRRLG